MRFLQVFCGGLVCYAFGVATCFVLMTAVHQREKNQIFCTLVKANAQLIEAKTELRVLEEQGLINNLPPPPPFEEAGDLKKMDLPEIPYEDDCDFQKAQSKE